MGKRVVIYSEYIDLLQQITTRHNLSAEDTQEVLNNFSVTQLPQDAPGSTNVTLIVEREKHPIEWRNKVGRIFEITGTNLRNKTTTLIYMATLLGVDWDELRPYLEDEKLYKQAKVIMGEISSGIPVLLILENQRHRFQVKVEKAIANASWRDNVSQELIPVNDVSLTEQLDWKAYRTHVGRFFDVQLVGKSRNFITQVGFEEATNLSNFSKEVCAFLVHYISLIRANKPRESRTAIKSRIEQFDQRITDFTTQLNSATQEFNLTKVLIEQATQDYNALIPLLSDSAIQTFLALAEKRKKVQQFSEQKKSYLSQKNDLSLSISQLETTISTKRKDISELQEKVGVLKHAFSIKANELTLPAEIISGFINSLESMEISRIIEYCQQLRVSPRTQDAHKNLADYNYDAISLGTTILGLKYFDVTIPNLAELKSNMGLAAKNAGILAELSNGINEVITRITRLGYITTEDYQNDVNGIEQLESVLETQKSELAQLELAISSYDSELAEAQRPYNSYKEVKDAYLVARTNMDESRLASLEQIAGRYESSVGEQLTELVQGQIRTLQERQRTNQHAIDDNSRLVNKLKSDRKKLQDLLDSLDETDDSEIRVNNLLKVKSFFQNVAEYFDHKKEYFETSESEMAEQATSNQENLADDFDTIITLINNRILNRCPFGFVNTESGVEERRVIQYDFLNSDFKVEGLEPGAQFHGGMSSCMTAYGLATKCSGADFGSILIVDEWGDVGDGYKKAIFSALAQLNHLTLGIFVDVDNNRSTADFEVRI